MSEASHAKPRYGTIFITLFVLTVCEIIAANLKLPKVSVVLILITFAIAKAALVAMFYMHLRFEKILLAVIALAPLAFSLILVLAIGHDIRVLALLRIVH